MLRAFVYIDGQNFYHGLKNLGLDGKHFNFRAYAELLTQRKELVAIKYFGARYPRSVSLEKHNRDDAFFKTLSNDLLINVIEGRFLISSVDGRQVPREKGVDVRLATELIFDAFYDAYDVAYILSSDTDLIPAIKEVKKKFPQKRIFNFSFNKLEDFNEACDECYQIYPYRAKKFIQQDLFKPTPETMADLKAKLEGKSTSAPRKQKKERNGPKQKKK